MNKKVIWQTTILGIIFIALFIGISAGIYWNGNRERSVFEADQTGNITLTIEDLYEDKEVSISSNKTVLEILRALDAEDKEVRLVTKEYTGLGILVESIGGKTNGENEEYWQYKVNKIMSQVGADKLQVTDGDFIEWYFDKSEY